MDGNLAGRDQVCARKVRILGDIRDRRIPDSRRDCVERNEVAVLVFAVGESYYLDAARGVGPVG